jgi:hypothetical protein
MDSEQRPGQITARDGMNHQDFALLARDFPDAFTGRHVKWLRTSLSFIFGNHPVYFVHVGRCRIVLEKVVSPWDEKV